MDAIVKSMHEEYDNSQKEKILCVTPKIKEEFKIFSSKCKNLENFEPLNSCFNEFLSLNPSLHELEDFLENLILSNKLKDETHLKDASDLLMEDIKNKIEYLLDDLELVQNAKILKEEIKRRN